MMQKRNCGYLGQKGIAQVLILAIMAVLAIALPLTTKLVQQKQETRSKAASSGACWEFIYVDGSHYDYVTNGSTYCDDDGWGYDDLKKCSNGTVTKVKNCGTETGMATASCVYTSKSIVSGELKSSARCRTDSDCTNKGGSCNADDSLSNGSNCTTTDGKYGKVESGLCWRTLDKKCCVPNATSSGKQAGESCSVSSSTNECASGLFCGCSGKCVSSQELWDFSLSSGCDTSTGNYRCTKKTYTSKITCGNYFFTTESACQNAAGCDKNVAPAATNGVCGSSKNTCNSGKLNDTTDDSTYYKWDCEGTNGGTTAHCTARKSSGGGSSSTGAKGQKCNSGVNGECITVSSSVKENSACTIPDKNIAGTIVFNKCDGGNTNRCCKVSSTCSEENAINGCADGTHIKKCVKDSSSDVLGYISEACPSGTTCSGSGATATCVAPVTPVNGACGTTNNACNAGTLNDIADSSTKYLWNCVGTNGGSTANCNLAIPTTSCTDANGTHPSGQNFCNGNILNGCANGQISLVVDCSTSGQICSNGTCVTQNAVIPKISFKFAFAGIKPNAKCIDQIKPLSLLVGNIPSMKTQELTANISIVSSETNSRGDQVFQIGLASLDASKFNTTDTHNYVRAKGYKHARMKFCANDQSSKLADSNCNMTLNGKVYTFINYPILPGDVTGETPGQQNGIINGQDYSYIKTRMMNDDGVESCGKDGDLNLDGVVNGNDIQLIKNSLGTRDDD